MSHIGRWNSLELVKGNFGPEDCVNDIAEIKFDRPVPIKVNIGKTDWISGDNYLYEGWI